VAQLFHPRFGFFVRLCMLGVIAMLIISILSWRAVTANPAGIGEGLEQPVPFSHKHHVGDAGIDCRYCHAAVEKSAFAGIPAVSTCMTCHSQLYTDQAALSPLIEASRGEGILRWQRLHKLPDFVYFNHSIHIAKGVGCATCHGAVDEMALTARVAPLTMQWCLACHRDPAPFLRPRAAVFDPQWTRSAHDKPGAQLLIDYDIDTRRLTDCSICHR
jgi:hypothetical protein